MNYKLIIFDLDGTLLDSLAHIIECVQQTAIKMGVDVPSDRFIRRGVGLTVIDQVNRIFPDVETNKKQKALELFKQCYFTSDQQYRLYPGVEKVLATLKNHHKFIGLATNMNRYGLQSVLTQTPLGELIDFGRCADDGPAKPNPQMIYDLMDLCAVAPEDTLMVGDSEYDILTAKNAGIDVIAVDYGAHSYERLTELQPLKIIESFEELI